MQPKKTITANPITIGIGLIAIAFVILLIFSLFQLFRPSAYGQGITIENLSEHIKDLPTDRRDSMQSSLYNAIKTNLPEGTEAPKQGAYIRVGSVSSKYNESTNINSGDFIVDIESIRQSYGIQYEWSSQKDNPNLSGYTVVVSCLSADKLIYDKFECSDAFNISSAEPYDVISQYLPHYDSTDTGDSIYVVSRQKIDGSKYLEVNVNACGDATKMDKAKQVIESWLKGIKLNPENFSYQYRNLCDGGA